MSLWQKLNEPVSLKRKGEKNQSPDEPAAAPAAPNAAVPAPEAKERKERRSVWEKLNQPVGGKAKRDAAPEPEPVAVVAPAAEAELTVEAAPEAVVEVAPEPVVEVAPEPALDIASAPLPEVDAEDDDDEVEWLTPPTQEPAPYEPPSLMDLVPTYTPDPEPLVAPEPEVVVAPETERLAAPEPQPVVDRAPVFAPEPQVAPEPQAAPEPEIAPEPALAPEPEPQVAEAETAPEPEARRKRAARRKPSLKGLAGKQLSLPSLKPSRGRRGRPVIGLDIEPGVVRVVQAHLEGGRIKVERAHSASLDVGVVRDGEVVQAEELSNVLRALFAEHKLDRRVRIGVANQRIVVREMLLPPIDDAKQLATAVTFMAADVLPMPVDQAVLDHVVLGPVETPEGPRVRVILVAARRSMIDTLLSATRAAGLKPQGIDLSAFAMVRALGEHPGAVLHLNVGGVVNLAVTNDGECGFTRVVAGGIESMAVELAERRSIEMEDARAALYAVRLDQPGATEDDRTHDAHVVLETGLRRIAGEVRNSLDFIVSDGSERSPAVERVVLSGPAIRIPGFAEALGERLALPIDVGDVHGVDEADLGLYTVAAGLTVEEVPA